MLKSFTHFLKGDQSPDSGHDIPDNELIRQFHEHHAHMEEVGRHLHKRGYNMEIEYKSHHVARHGRDGHGSTLFYNQALLSPKEVSVSKSAIAVKRNK